MTVVALIGLATGIGLVRLGWNGRRSWAMAGWILLLAALFVLVWLDGAWGCAIGVVTGIVAAVTAILHAGWRAPVGPVRQWRGLPAWSMPHGAHGVARVLAVFVLTVPVGFVAAQWLAFGLQASMRRAGAGAADATVLAFFAQPTGWAIIMAAQMTRRGPVAMIAAPMVAALVGTILWGMA